jgi:hypothetical protein
LALKDVLGEDPEDDLAVGPADQDVTVSMTNTSWSAGSTTFVDEVPEKSSPPPSPSQPTAPFDTNEPMLDDQHSFVHNSQVHDNLDSDARSPPLQQPDTASQNDTPGIHNHAPFTQPLINTINSSPVTEKDRRGHYAEPVHSIARDDLLSPVEISHLQLTNFARASMDMTEYDDAWRPPFPPALSSPRSPAPTSTFELLASPFGSPSARVLSPRLSAFIGRHSRSTSGVEVETQSAHDSDLDSPQAHPVPTPAQVSSAALPAELLFDVLANGPDGTEACANIILGEAAGLLLEEAGKISAGKDNVKEEEGGKDQNDDKATGDISCGPTSQRYAEGSDVTAIYNHTQQATQQEVQPVTNRSSRSSTRSRRSRQLEFCKDETTVTSFNARHSVNQHSSLAESLPSSVPLTSKAPLLSERIPEPLLSSNPQEIPSSDSDKIHFPVLGKLTSESESCVNGNVGLAYPEPTEQDERGDLSEFTSLYGAYSDHSSSPPQESASSIELQDYRSTDITLGESSSISTPLSFDRERIFIPPSPEYRNPLMRNDSRSSHSPLGSQHPFSMSSRGSRIGSPLGVRPELRNGIDGVDDLKSPTSSEDSTSRKVPFGWRHSLVSVSTSCRPF